MLGLVAVVVVFFVFAIGMNFLIVAPVMRQGYRPWRSPRTARPVYAFHSENSVQFRGGQRVGWLNASWPASKLTVDSAWASVEGPLRDVWVSRDSVAHVRRIRGMMGSGVLFETTDGSLDGLIFWTKNLAVFEQLRQFGWPD